jgi:hypothetical protein
LAARPPAAALAPLARAFVARFQGYLPKAHHPLRYGMHANGAFALAFALDYARRPGEPALEEPCIAKARA